MILNAYSLLDVKSGVFSPPFFLIHDSIALRAVSELMTDKTCVPARYPSDFVLYCVGAFDDNLGSFTHLPPRNLGVLSAIAAQSASADAS